MPTSQVRIITAGIMLSLFMTSIEGTVVSTAMPTIIGQLGGLATYSWVFSAYMLASTTTMPIYGKMSDIYGRRPVYVVSMLLFLVGSVLSGQSQSMGQLIAFRALQGLGAGGVMPLAFTMIGDLYSWEQRAKMQGIFASVWGVSAILGPLLGGFLVDQVSWHWVFYVNVLPGILATVLVAMYWHDAPRGSEARSRSVDLPGVVLLTGAIVALMLGLFQIGTVLSWTLFAISGVLVAGLLYVERRVEDPLLPLGLFRTRLFAAATAHGLLVGWTVFGGTSFVPLFVQAVQQTSATVAGATVLAQSMAWVLASVVASRLLLRFNFRTLAVSGMALFVVGSFILSQANAFTPRPLLMVGLALIGTGMGCSMPSFMIAVQATVARAELGAATSTLQFSRSIGGTLGVSVLGAILTGQLARRLAAAGIAADPASLNAMLSPGRHVSLGGGVDEAMRQALAGALGDVFLMGFFVGILAFGATLLAPKLRLASSQRPVGGDGEGMPAAVGVRRRE